MNALTRWLLNKPLATRGDLFAALDIGTSKIVCFIARVDERGQPSVVGIGHHVAEGVRGGGVADMDSVQRAIAASVAAAEQMAGETIERVLINIGGAHLASQTVQIDMPIHEREITPADMERLLAQGQGLLTDEPQGPTREMIHTLPVQFTLDGQKGIRDPVGMIGNSLHAQLHLVSASFGPVRTLVTAIARCHLEVERLVATPYASGLACLVEDEMDLGCTIVDMGAGTTSLGIFFDGRLIHTDGVALGGAHITNDIARGLTTTLAHAERLKTLHGSAILGPLDDREMVDAPQVGEEDIENANPVPKSQLIRIIQPRVEEIFELVRTRLEKSGLNETAGRRVVITGGASQMPGLRDVAQRVLDKQVRLGRPLRITRPYLPARTGAPSLTGLADATSGPAFATAAGLLAVAMQPDLAATPMASDYAVGGCWPRLVQWVRQNM